MNLLVENTYRALDFYERGLLSESELLDLIESGVIDVEMLDEGFVNKLKSAAKGVALASMIGSAGVGVASYHKGAELENIRNNAHNNYAVSINKAAKDFKVDANHNAINDHINKTLQIKQSISDEYGNHLNNKKSYLNNPDVQKHMAKLDTHEKIVKNGHDQINTINNNRDNQIKNVYKNSVQKNGTFSALGASLKKGYNDARAAMGKSVDKSDEEKQIDMINKVADDNIKNINSKIQPSKNVLNKQENIDFKKRVEETKDDIERIDNLKKETDGDINHLKGVQNDLNKKKEDAINANKKYNESFSGKMHRSIKGAISMGKALFSSK